MLMCYVPTIVPEQVRFSPDNQDAPCECFPFVSTREYEPVSNEWDLWPHLLKYFWCAERQVFIDLDASKSEDKVYGFK